MTTKIESVTGETTTELPSTDHWGQPVRHYDNECEGAGERRECQSCGESLRIGLVAATDGSGNDRWEEFYKCKSCGARGTFRFDGKATSREAQRTWTGRMDYPE